MNQGHGLIGNQNYEKEKTFNACDDEERNKNAQSNFKVGTKARS